MAVAGINHLTFAVRDVDRSLSFYTDVLGLKLRARFPGGAYLTAGDTWIALLQDDQTRDAPLPEYTHVAFHAPEEELDSLVTRIRDAGARIWQENQTEGASLYFLDPDGHKLEIHASDLETRIDHARRAGWDDLETYD